MNITELQQSYASHPNVEGVCRLLKDNSVQMCIRDSVYSDGHHFQLQFICQLESTSLEVPHVSREGTCHFGKYYQLHAVFQR